MPKKFKPKTTEGRERSRQTHLIVALDCIDEGLVSHNLSVSVEESLKTILDGLQLQFTDLRREEQGHKHSSNREVI